MPQTLSKADLPSLPGLEIAPSSWLEISQERVNRFADATDDHQFIHVDPEKAAQTPFKGTIAHGYLTLSLVPFLTGENFPRIEGLLMGINYGSDKVRFLRAVRVGSRVRARQEILDATEKKAGQWLIKSRVTVEIENESKPALIADTLALFIVQ